MCYNKFNFKETICLSEFNSKLKQFDSDRISSFTKQKAKKKKKKISGDLAFAV